MAKIITDNQHYADIAAAIREKNETETVYKPSEMAPAILAIQGGAELNFEVVGGETEPVDPVENTIWVNTPDEITGWAFSAAEPNDPYDGMVWIFTGALNYVGFNALKKNGIQVYPKSSKQYLDSAWKNVETKIYKDNEWKPFILIIYENGELLKGGVGEVTNGNAYSYSMLDGGEWKIALSGSGTTIGYTTEAFDLTGISELKFMAKMSSANQNITGTIEFGVASTQTDASFVAKQSLTVSSEISEKEYILDLSNSELIGEYYIKVVVKRTSNNYYHAIMIDDIRGT